MKKINNKGMLPVKNLCDFLLARLNYYQSIFDSDCPLFFQTYSCLILVCDLLFRIGAVFWFDPIKRLWTIIEYPSKESV